MSRAAALLGALAAGALACATPAERPAPPRAADPLGAWTSAPGRPERVLLISVSGLTPRWLAAAGEGGPHLPTLAALARGGVAAETVEPVAPASRWPAHTSLVTGRRPGRHGVGADHPIGEHGVRGAFHSHASHVQGPTLWSAAAEAGQRVAALGWPATTGAAIELLIPDIPAARRGMSWLAELGDGATPWLVELATRHGARDPATRLPGPARDAVLVAVACEVLGSAAPPRLLLLQLSQTAAVLAREGPDAVAARAAFARADAELERLLRCLEAAGRLSDAALVVVGDHGTLPLHSELRPNALLEAEGLLVRESGGRTLRGWRALVRSNGGSAFVYARSEADALRARDLLGKEAERSGAFRLVTADEMLRLGADREAWFGLEARPGYVFSDDASPPPRGPTALRGGGGYLPDEPRMEPAFVAFGRGVREGVRVPWMRQIDVAPTVAALLGVPLREAEGSALLGALALPRGVGALAEGR